MRDHGLWKLATSTLAAALLGGAATFLLAGKDGTLGARVTASEAEVTRLRDATDALLPAMARLEVGLQAVLDEVRRVGKELAEVRAEQGKRTEHVYRIPELQEGQREILRRLGTLERP